MEKPQKTFMASKAWRWALIGAALLISAIWLVLTPEGLLGKADAVGYAVCHQIDARSYHIGERAMAMCARCSGLFLGALLGLIYQLFGRRKGKMPPPAVLFLFGVFALSWVVDGVNSFGMLVPFMPSLYATQNWTRLVTGTGMGLAISVILMPSFIQTMFTRWEDASMFGDWRHVAVLVFGAALLDVLILAEFPWVLYALSALSAVGVMALLTMVYSMVVVMLYKKENTIEQVAQLVLPLTAGFILALLQIGAFDLVRYMMTGTWEGFNPNSLSAIIKESRI